MLNPWLGISLVLGMLGGSMLALSRFGGRLAICPEAVRKLLHVNMGVVTLSFPWLFTKAWPVLMLASLSVIWFLSLRTFKPLGRQFGAVLDSVGRTSAGEICFALGTCLVFIFSAGDMKLYCIPMLILTLADAGAALTGEYFGKHRYPIGGGEKSIEGCTAFFSIAFLCIYIPLCLLTDMGQTEMFRIALLVAFFTTIFEAISGGGLDNLVVPLAGFVLLKIYL